MIPRTNIPKPYTSTSIDGNAYAVLTAVRRALRKAGASEETQEAFSREAKSGDYAHLLEVAMEYVEFD